MAMSCCITAICRVLHFVPNKSTSAPKKFATIHEKKTLLHLTSGKASKRGAEKERGLGQCGGAGEASQEEGEWVTRFSIEKFGTEVISWEMKPIKHPNASSSNCTFGFCLSSRRCRRVPLILYIFAAARIGPPALS
jgi:hypothetical protein